MELDWQSIRVVVFDVDGTLYDQSPMRRRMAGELLAYCLRHPGRLATLRIIYHFRRCRVQLAEEESVGVARAQYKRPAERLGIEPQAVQAVVEEWIDERPLRHLRACRYPGVGRICAALASMGCQLGVFSDYPARRKVEALELAADHVVSSVDPDVDRLKPHPAGLIRVMELTDTSPEAVLLIGDRPDRDGECARRAGARFLLKTHGARANHEGFADFRQLLAALPG